MSLMFIGTQTPHVLYSYMRNVRNGRGIIRTYNISRSRKCASVLLKTKHDTCGWYINTFMLLICVAYTLNGLIFV